MALQKLASNIIIPQISDIVATSQSNLIDAAGEKFAVIFRVERDGDLKRLRFRTATVTTGATVRVSFQAVSASTGDPDGTDLAYRDVTVNSTDDNLWLQTGLITDDGTDGGNHLTVTKGQWLAIVFSYPGSAGNMNIESTSAFFTTDVAVYTDLYTTSWAKTISRLGVIELEYTDGFFPTYGLQAYRPTTATFSNASADREIGNRFRLPWPVSCSGVCALIDGDEAFELKLYDDSSTQLGIVAGFDPQIRASTARTTAFYQWDGGDVELAANTWYRIVAKPTTSTSIGYVYLTPASTDAFTYLWGLGDNMVRTQRDSGGSWTQTTTQRVCIFPLINGFDDGVGAGGRSLML